MGYDVGELRVFASVQLAIWKTYVRCGRVDRQHRRGAVGLTQAMQTTLCIAVGIALLQPLLQTSFDESWRALNFGDLIFSILIGLCCGFIGALFTQTHLLTIDVRRALQKRFPSGVPGFLADKYVAMPVAT
jgi:hypothetical protein